MTQTLLWGVIVVLRAGAGAGASHGVALTLKSFTKTTEAIAKVEANKIPGIFHDAGSQTVKDVAEFRAPPKFAWPKVASHPPPTVNPREEGDTHPFHKLSPPFDPLRPINICRPIRKQSSIAVRHDEVFRPLSANGTMLLALLRFQDFQIALSCSHWWLSPSSEAFSNRGRPRNES